MGLLDGDIAATAHDALGDILLDLTVAPKVVTSIGPGKFADSWPVGHAGKGFVEDYGDFARASGIPATDRKIVILAKSLLDGSGAEVAPARGGRVTVQGRTYDIVEARRDPAGATWELQAR